MDKVLWTTGVSVHYGYGGKRDGLEYYGWWASMKWTDGGHCEPGTMEGTIETRYAEPTLQEAIDYVLTIAERFGIQLGVGDMKPTVYYKGDGEWEDYPAPEGWRETIATECSRRGWFCIYTRTA